VSGMIGSGLLCLVLGLPLAVLGLHLRKGREAPGKAKKHKGKDHAARPPRGSGSLVWGGAAFALLGVALIAAALLRG
jgi:hypothetical protein